MKATLTIEVPDDFEKGDCYNCGFRQMVYGYDFELDCEDERDNCPLEIQDESVYEERYIDCASCKHKRFCQEWIGSDTCNYEPMGE